MNRRLSALLILALWLALVDVVGAQGVAPPKSDDRKGGPVNAWGTPDAALKFFNTLPAYQEALSKMTYTQLEAERAKVLADAGNAAAGSAAYAEATTKEALIRSAMYRIKANPAPTNR